jgi:hypothetical protein
MPGFGASIRQSALRQYADSGIRTVEFLATQGRIETRIIWWELIQNFG